MRRIRVLRVIARTNVGGPAVQVRSLMTGLDPDRYDCLLVAGEVGADEQEALRDEEEPFAIIRIRSFGRRVDLGADLAAARRLSQVLARFRPDVLHTHTAKAGFTGRLLGAAQRVPVRVHTFHGHLLHGYYGPAGTRAVISVERALATATTHLLAVGRRVRDELLAAGIGRPERFSVMPAGIPVPDPVPRAVARRRWGIGEDAAVVAVVGRMVPVKRLDRAADVVARVAAERPGLVVLAAGDGPQRERLADASGRADVRLLGWQSDVAAVFAAADLVLLTSDNEGMPISLVEAGMLGIPAVATDVGSVSEVVLDGRSGLVRGTDPAALAQAVLTLLGSVELRERMGAAARAWTVESFSAQRLVHDHDALYRALLARRRA